MNRVKWAVVLVLGLSLGALVFQNRQPVQVRFLVFGLEMPLILLLLIMTTGGIVIGLLLAVILRSGAMERS